MNEINSAYSRVKLREETLGQSTPIGTLYIDLELESGHGWEHTHVSVSFGVDCPSVSSCNFTLNVFVKLS